MRTLVLSSQFRRQAKKLVKRDRQLKKNLKATLEYLSGNLKHPSLNLHKLAGQNNWSASVTDDIRIILHWEENKLYLLKIGHHNEVY